MVKFNIGDFPTISQFAFAPLHVNRANEKFKQLLEFFDKNDCVDLAIKFIEHVKDEKQTIGFGALCAFLTLVSNLEIDTAFQVKDDRLQCTQEMQNLANILLDIIILFNYYTVRFSYHITETFYAFLLELKAKKQKHPQSQGIKLWTKVRTNWKASVFCAFNIVLFIVSVTYWLLF